jgi:hypothetical protein
MNKPDEKRKALFIRLSRRWGAEEKTTMKKIIDGIKYDLGFLKTHTLQPKWFKRLKIFLLIGVLVSYSILIGFEEMVVFFITLVFLMLVVHMIYRINTDKFTKNWLDFNVVIEDGEYRYKKRSIGKFYYPMIIINTAISVIVSQLLT